MHYERYLVAYDISETKRRNKVYKLLKEWGERVNLSVFECELDKKNFPTLRKEILKMIKKSEDVVIYYPLCLNCMAGVVSDGSPVPRILDKTILTV